MLWNKKKTVQQQGGAEKEPDFQVLMIGQRRTGKSSVLSAMLKSIDKLTADTGICIEAADPETRVLMQKKLSQLQLIFDIFRLGETFSTLSGEAEGGAYSPPNDETISYRFHMYLNNREDSSKSYMVEFVDIRGEDMMSDLSDRSQTVLEQISRSSVVIVAVDAPALMEVWKEKYGYGRYHNSVNIPDNIWHSITEADAMLRQRIEEQNAAGETEIKFPPKLILFVPLKCEKYYHDRKMEQLNQAVHRGYADLFTFLDAHEEYTAAITPIMTLGDVIFDHYGMKTLPDGREIVDCFDIDVPKSMHGTPKSPMFAFRKTAKPRYSPMYCEQPLLYLLMYVTCIMQKSSETPQKERGGFGIHTLLKIVVGGTVLAINPWVAALLMLAYGKGVRRVSSDPEFLKAVRNSGKLLKLRGDGYELVTDHLGFEELKREAE